MIPINYDDARALVGLATLNLDAPEPHNSLQFSR